MTRSPMTRLLSYRTLWYIPRKNLARLARYLGISTKDKLRSEVVDAIARKETSLLLNGTEAHWHAEEL